MVKGTEVDEPSTGKLVGVPSVLVFLAEDEFALGRGVLVQLITPELLRLQLVVTNAMLVEMLGSSVYVI